MSNADAWAQTHGTNPSLPHLPDELLCRIALGGLQPDDLPPPPPCETELSPDYYEEEEQLEREGNEQRLRLAWAEFRARRQLLATFRCVCHAWRAALTEGAACLPTWLSPEAALRPVGPWPQRLRTLCLAVPGQVVKEQPDLDTWQQQLTMELHALFPNLLQIHFRVIDLMPRLGWSLKWRVGRTRFPDQAPKWVGWYPHRDETARDVPALVMDSQLLPEGHVGLGFTYEWYEWTGKDSPRPEGGSDTYWPCLELQGPLTLRALMPLVERYLLNECPFMHEEGSTHHLKLGGLRHLGGGHLDMQMDFWPSAPRPDDDD